MTFEERAEDLAANVASLGYDLDGLTEAGRLVIDHVRVERSEIEETGQYDLEGLFIRLGYTCQLPSYSFEVCMNDRHGETLAGFLARSDRPHGPGQT